MSDMFFSYGNKILKTKKEERLTFLGRFRFDSLTTSQAKSVYSNVNICKSWYTFVTRELLLVNCCIFTVVIVYYYSIFIHCTNSEFLIG